MLTDLVRCSVVAEDLRQMRPHESAHAPALKAGRNPVDVHRVGTLQHVGSEPGPPVQIAHIQSNFGEKCSEVGTETVVAQSQTEIIPFHFLSDSG